MYMYIRYFSKDDTQNTPRVKEVFVIYTSTTACRCTHSHEVVGYNNNDTDVLECTHNVRLQGEVNTLHMTFTLGEGGDVIEQAL